ncbi:MAG: hypothetical protein JXA41_10400 [Deltaproteobacteria bacterium]|nr:hypothetical protein [Deltaproteobacteria bacterium]
MNPRYEVYRELWRLCTRPVFLITDLLGLLGIITAQYVPNPFVGGVTALGSALLTIGVSLPVALFYQLRANAESLTILDTCNRAGIRAIFKSRSDDSVRLRTAIDSAAAKTTEIKLLGVAFRSLFNPSSEYTPHMRSRLDDPRVRLRVLLLDPESDAAIRRASIEQGNTTLEDVRFTINNGIPSTINERLKQLKKQRKEQNGQNTKHPDHEHNVEVRIYDINPMAFMMIFEESLFTEQYHIGRPDNLRFGSCIGKHVPVIQYSSGAEASAFLVKHFDKMWEMGRDITDDVIKLATSPDISIDVKTGG